MKTDQRLDASSLHKVATVQKANLKMKKGLSKLGGQYHYQHSVKQKLRVNERQGREGRGQALRWGGQHGQRTHASLTPLHDSSSRSSKWWGWRWKRGQKKCPGDEGRCHCIGGVNTYGAEILIKRERGKSKSRVHKKSSSRSGRGGEKQKDPEGEEQC